MAPAAIADPPNLPQLSWSHGNLTTDTGRFELSWTPGADAGGYTTAQILETTPDQQTAPGDYSSHYYASGSSQSFLSYVPQTRTFQVRACRREISHQPFTCGAWSSEVSVVITPAAEAGRATVLRSELPPLDPNIMTNAGPAIMSPGLYQSGLTRKNGWYMHWANDLRYSADHELYGNNYDLYVTWLTYMDRAGANPPAGQENLQPVWLIGGLNYETQGKYSGQLQLVTVNPHDFTQYRRDNIGKLEVLSNNATPIVNWQVNDWRFYQGMGPGSTPWIQDTLAASNTKYNIPLIPENKFDHFQGDWLPHHSIQNKYQAFTLQSYMAGKFEMLSIVFFDSAGLPIWATAQWGGYRANEPDRGRAPNGNLDDAFCAYVTMHTWYPNIDWETLNPEPVPVNVPAGGDCILPSESSEGTGANIRRQFGPVVPGTEQPGQVRINMQIPPAADSQGQPKTLVHPAPGSGQTELQIKQATNHTDVSYFIDGVQNPSTCEVAPGQSCELDLTWYTDGNYPHARLFLFDVGGSQPVDSIASWPSGGDYTRVEYPYAIAQPGQYQFRLYRYNDNPILSDSQLLARSRNLEVVESTGPGQPDPDIPPPPAGPPQIAPDPSSASVGSLSGDFRVSETGAATYSVPIMTAPASGGFAPRISLEYNSTAPPGEMGPGWSIGGLSSITRCGQAPEYGDPVTLPAAVDAEDRFCLDGQRLHVLPGQTYGAHGAEYRTEIDPIARIRSYGTAGSGPAYFVVQRKDGTTAWYGTNDAGNTSSAVASGLPGGEILSWHIGRVQDSSFNFYNFIWNEFAAANTATETLISSIEFTGNRAPSHSPQQPTHSIQFTYDLMPASERTRRHFAGIRLESTRRLTSIRSNASAEELRTYHLGYRPPHSQGTYSHLEEITECNGSTCYPPTRFLWSEGGHFTGVSPTQASIGLINNLETATPVDLTGDGRQELVYARRDGDYLRLGVIWMDQANTWRKTEFGEEIRTPCRLGLEDIGGLQIIDVHGSGKPNVIYPAACTSEATPGIFMHRVVREKTRLRLGQPQHVAPLPFDPEQMSEPRLHVLDWTGDGLADLLLTSTNAAHSTDSTSITAYRNISQEGSQLFSVPSPIIGLMSSWNITYSCDQSQVPIPRFFMRLAEPFAPFAIDSSGKAAFAVHQHLHYTCADSQPGGPEDPIIMWPSGVPDPDTPMLYEDFVEFGETQHYRVAVLTLEQSSTGQVAADFFGSINAGPDDHVHAVDINADGLTDILVIGGNGNQDRQIRLQINDGLALSQPTVLTHINRHAAALAYFMDYNGNGYPDLILPGSLSSTMNCSGDGSLSNSNCWLIRRNTWNNGQVGFAQNPAQGPRVGNLQGGDLAGFWDFRGNGLNGLWNFRRSGSNYQLWTSQGNHHACSAATCPSGMGVIRSITDGHGARTDIFYAPLTDTNVYHSANGAPYTGYGQGSIALDVMAPTYVVSRIASHAPQHEINPGFTGLIAQPTMQAEIEYHYRSARLQAGGRGFLGFEQVATFDPQSRIITVTEYAQDFPFTGRPVRTTRVQSASADANWGVLSTIGTSAPGCGMLGSGRARLSDSVSSWSQVATSPRSAYLYADENIDYACEVSHSGSQPTASQQISRVVTTTSNVSIHGNVGSTQSHTYGPTGALVKSQTTNNQYGDDNVANWHLGRLTSSTVATSRPVQGTVTRSTEFQYHATTKQLTREIVEPGHTWLHHETAYTLDRFGNRTHTTVSGANTQPRQHQRVYDAAGRFVNTTLNHYGQVEQQVIERDAYGNPTRVLDIHGQESRVWYDAMGRQHTTYTPDGASSVTTWYQGGANLCPANFTAFHQVTESRGAPAAFKCFDVLGRSVREGSEAFASPGTSAGRLWNVVDTAYDSSGRVNGITEPYPLNGSPAWSLTEYDEIGRVIKTRHADTSVHTWSYHRDTNHGAATRSVVVNPLGQSKQEWKNALGEIVRVQDDLGGALTYTYDAIGNVVAVTGPLGTVSMEYDLAGNKRLMTDPDKGTWQYRHNAYGELTCQRDAEGQLTRFTYDSLGRETERRFFTTGSLTTSGCSGAGTPVGAFTWAFNNTTGTGGSTGQLMTHAGHYDGQHFADHYHYDTLGRLSERSRGVDGHDFTERHTYDQFGRPFQRFDAAEAFDPYLGERYHYAASGYLARVQEAKYGPAGEIYLEVLAMDARGNVTQQVLGNGVVTDRHYDAANGQLEWIGSAHGLNTHLQHLTYEWDAHGNLTRRHDISNGWNVQEDFGYDDLNRLTTVHLTAPGLNNHLVENIGYHAAGRIQSRQGVGNYQYNGGNTHAVSAVSGSGSLAGTSYSYDANGNQISSNQGRTIDYTIFQQARLVSQGSDSVAWWYTAGGRYKREDNDGGSLATTYYMGSTEITVDDTHTTYRRSVAGQVVVKIVQNGNHHTQEAHYLLFDHLGSVHTITDAAGQALHELRFSAWGTRRAAGAPLQTPLWADITAFRDITPRGFTGHEMVDRLGLIHMNGRLYDPALGRFVQADPVVQAPTNTQNLDRYQYVFNNPLSYTDPSGHISWKMVAKIAIAAVITWFTAGIASGAIGASVFGTLGPTAKLAVMAAGGALSGAVMTGTLEGAFWGALGGAIGGGFAVSGWGATAQFVGRAVAGGAMSHLQGGKFGHGFAAAGAAQLANPAIEEAFQHDTSRFVANTIVGGTVSQATGGKFANGAVSAGVSYALGQIGSGGAGGQQTDSAEMSDAELDAKVAAHMQEHGGYNYETAIAYEEPSAFHRLTGVAAGENAAMYWAGRQAETGNWLYAIPGMAASLWTPDTYLDTFSTLAGGGLGSGFLRGFRWGGEISIGRNFRAAPFGNRTGNPTGRYPHYHRRGLDPNTGITQPGQGIGRHRPWDARSTDRSWKDRF